MRASVIFLVALGGCVSQPLDGGSVSSSTPSAASAEDALTIVWEQTYGMSRETRPQVDWFSDCFRPADFFPAGQINPLAMQWGWGTEHCVLGAVSPDGVLHVRSGVSDPDTTRGKTISDTWFAAGLRIEQQIVTGKFIVASTSSDAMVSLANANLRAAGL